MFECFDSLKNKKLFKKNLNHLKIKHMKKLSLMIVLGSLCLLSIAKPAINVSQFETYSQQMQALSAKYIAANQYENANKTVTVWLNSYNTLTDKEKANYSNVDAQIMYNQACSLTRTNDKFQALKALKEAVNAGFNNKAKLENDPNLVELKQYEEFNKILNSIKS